MSNFKRIVSLLLAMVLLLGAVSSLASCGGNAVISNEETRLVLSTSELDGVFNPFYSSSAPDGSVVGMTQIGMLSSDKDGKVAFGEDEACVVLDYEEITSYDQKNNPLETTYRFVLKNGLKFSDGSPLTMRDVLFNLYVYLDPAYYGSSTIYSTEIKGLQEYRTQSTDKNQQEAFQKNFDSLAADRILRLKELIENVYDLDAYKDASISASQMLVELQLQIDDYQGFKNGALYLTVIDDYKLAEKYFLEELKTDYGYAIGTAEDIKFTFDYIIKHAGSLGSQAYFLTDYYQSNVIDGDFASIKEIIGDIYVGEVLELVGLASGEEDAWKLLKLEDKDYVDTILNIQVKEVLSWG